MEFHHRMFGDTVPPIPLTVEKVFCVAALFKEGGYRAFRSYLSKAKAMHVLAGHAWEVQLEMAFRKATLSVLRGLWVARRSASFRPRRRDHCRQG